MGRKLVSSLSLAIVLTVFLEDLVNGLTSCSTSNTFQSLYNNSSVLGPQYDINPLANGRDHPQDSNFLVLLTSVKFDCYGEVKHWTGLIQVDNSSSTQEEEIQLQVWRPQNNGTWFTLIGSSLLLLDSDSVELRNFVWPEDESNENETEGQNGNKTAPSEMLPSYYNFSLRLEGNGTQTFENNVIPFQPGDIVGIYTASLNYANLVFKNVTDISEMSYQYQFFTTVQLKCSICHNSPVVVKSVIPLIIPHYVDYCEDDFLEPGDILPLCMNSSTSCTDTSTCTDCGDTSNKLAPDLLILIVSVCAAGVCIIGIIINAVIITACCLKCRSKNKKKKKDSEGERDETDCRFIVNPQVLQNEYPSNIKSLADFLQFNIQNESTSDSFNVSWV